MRTGNREARALKAIIQEGYGAPDVLSVQERDPPVPSESEALVRVRAAGVNIGDWHLLRGVPYLVRVMFGLRRPRREIPGMDVAGHVEAVGSEVQDLAVGDEVFGWCDGAFAERVAAPADQLLAKPVALSFEQAAAVGDSALTALRAVRDEGQVQAGQAVLVNGASGGVGTFAVQIAAARGARVTAVCSAQNEELVRSIGAEEVIDYTREDFTERTGRFDVIVDLVANRPLSACRRALTPRGTYVLVGVREMGRWVGLGPQAALLARRPFARQRLRTFVTTHRRDDLLALKQLVEAGKLAPVIDRVYPLAEAAAALRHQGEGGPRGKLVLRLET